MVNVTFTIWGILILYPEASKTQGHICQEAPAYLQIFLCFPICQTRNGPWLQPVAAETCHKTGSPVTGVLAAVGYSHRRQVAAQDFVFYSTDLAQMLPHSPNGPECVWINPTSMSVGFCQAEEEETLYQDPGTAKPLPQRVYEWHRGLRGPRGFQAHPTSSTSQGRGARPQGQCLGPGTAAILMGTEVQWPRESLEGGPKTRAQRAFPRLAWEVGSCPHGKRGCAPSPEWSSEVAAAGTHDGPRAAGSKIMMVQRSD